MKSKRRNAKAGAALTPRLKKAAIEAALAAGEIIRRGFGKVGAAREKSGAGIVTEIDIRAEKKTIQILKRAEPSFGLIAEESHSLDFNPKQPGRFIIDPLDGTTNFFHGFPMFCVSIAVEIEGNLEFGVIYHPIFKDLYIAERGQGAFLNKKRMTVSKTKTIHEALLTTGFSYYREEVLHQALGPFERLSNLARGVRRPGSAALDLAYTARGVFDGFWEVGLSPWDIAAGVLLVQEAGGVVTDYSGGKVDIRRNNVIASNPFLHPQLRKAIAPEFCRLPEKP